MGPAPTRRDLIRELAVGIAGRAGAGVVMVGIDGVDAAGKSTFAGELAAALAGLDATAVQVSIDGFHNRAAVRHARRDGSPGASYYEDSFDYGSFRELVLDHLGPGGDNVIQPSVFDHVRDEPVSPEPIHLAPDSILIVDGIFLGRPELAAAWDVWIFLHVSPNIARSRGVARDHLLFGSYASTEQRYEHHYEAGQRIYLETIDPRSHAHVVIDNDDLDAPRIIRTSLP